MTALSDDVVLGTALYDVVTTSQLLVTCGPGGVGKTTTAAALAVAAANTGRRVVVVTVDPARRLADALGLHPGAASNDPHRLEGVGEANGGELWALMLDAEETFDRLVREQAESEQHAEAILGNPVYQAISGSLSGAQEYMAIERLHQLWVTDDWDLVVVDTPPSRHAIDLLEAPDRLVRFLGSPIYRTLTAGQRAFARITDTATSVFLWAVKRLAGPQIVQDSIELFRSLSPLESGLRQRAKDVAALLRDERTAFVVVSSPRAEAVAEATHLVEALAAGRYPFAGAVINLLHPMPAPIPHDGLRLLDELDGGPLADHFAWHAELTELAVAEREELRSLVELVGGLPLVELPLLDVEVNDVEGLALLAERLTSPNAAG